MTAQECYTLFHKAMMEKRIIRYENETSRDDYHTYAIRETPMGYMFFCLLETFFRTGKNLDSWIAGSLKSFHDFHTVQGATIESLQLTNEHFVPVSDYKERLPKIVIGGAAWVTVD